MFELFVRLQLAAKGMWRYRWHGLAAAWLVAVVGVIAAFRIPAQYEASARIYVDTQSILKPLMSGLTVQPNVDQQVTILSRTLISRPNVEKLIQMADLDLGSRTKAQQDATVERVMKTLTISGTGRDNLYTLSYRESDPNRAVRAVQSLVSIFVESSLGANRKDTASAKSFLDEQIKAYRAKLEDAEARLKEFRLRNIDVQYAEGKDAASRLGEIVAELDRAKLELNEAVNARDAAKAALDGEKRQGASVVTQSLMQESALAVSTPDLDGRIDVQRRNLDALLQRYTEQHPDVVATRKLLTDLEEQKKKAVAELRKGAMGAQMGSVVTTDSSLAAQEMQRLLATTQVQVASLRARVAEYGARHRQALEALKVAPQLEAEAARLNRDYAVHKKNYDDLVARRESATMSGELDVASGLADFRLIDPPRASPNPVWPNRLLLVALTLAAAVGVGLVTALALSELRPVFYRAGDLRNRFPVPVLGVVSKVLNDQDVRRRRTDLIRFGAASGSLVGIFLVGLAVMSIFTSR